MGDADKWNSGFKKFNVSLLIASWVIIMLIPSRKLLTSFLCFFPSSTGTFVEEA